MKKKFKFTLFVICALFLLLFALFGCDQNKTDNAQTPNNNSDGILSSLFFKISGDELSGKVSNSTTKFSFSNNIDVVSTATYTISTDMNGDDIIKSKTVNLNIGDNVFYVIVENGNDAFVYTATIRRRPIYDVNFIANGSVRYHVTVEEDGFISEPKESITIKGYEFNGWNFDFSKPIVNDTTIYLKYDKPIIYSVQFDLNDDELFYKAEYDNNLTECTINNIPKYPIAKGYKFVKWSSAFDDVNRTVVFKANWELEEYKISYEFNDDYSVSQVKSKESYPTSYTVESEVDFQLPERDGYTLIAWDALPIQKGSVGDVAFTAEWDVVWYNVTYLLNDDALPQKAINSISNPERVTIERRYWLKDPKCEGFEFFGWYCDDEMGERIITISEGTHENITVCGVWGTKGLSFPYKTTGNETSVIGYSGESNSVVLPKRYYGAIVNKIGENALSLNRITSVTIPDSIVEIGASAFKNTSITSIVIPNNVKIIGDNAFKNCSSLTTVNWNAISCRTKIEIFDDCLSLTEVNIGDNVTTIPDGAFQECQGLVSVTIPDSVTRIGDYAFWWCQRLSNICFKGTQAQWNAITKGIVWNASVATNCTINCTDGTIDGTI